MLHVWNLGLELGGGVDVPASRHRARPSERDEIGRLAPVPGLVGGVTDPLPKHIGRHVPTQITDAAARWSSTRLPSATGGRSPRSTRTHRTPSRAAAAAVSRQWLLCAAPLVTSTVAAWASASAQLYCSLRTWLPPPPRPLRSSRLIHRSFSARPTRVARRGARSKGVGQVPSTTGSISSGDLTTAQCRVPTRGRQSPRRPVPA